MAIAVTTRRGHLRNGRTIIRPHLLRVKEQSAISQGSVGGGFEPIVEPNIMEDLARESERRVEREEDERVARERVQREQFNRKLEREMSASQRRDFEKRLRRASRPIWSEEE